MNINLHPGTPEQFIKYVKKHKKTDYLNLKILEYQFLRNYLSDEQRRKYEKLHRIKFD